MQRSRFTDKQIIEILNEAEVGVGIVDLCRRHGISQSTFYRWREKYVGMTVSELKRMRRLEEENRQLKQMYADLSLEHAILKDIVAKKL